MVYFKFILRFKYDKGDAYMRNSGHLDDVFLTYSSKHISNIFVFGACQEVYLKNQNKRVVGSTSVATSTPKMALSCSPIILLYTNILLYY